MQSTSWHIIMILVLSILAALTGCGSDSTRPLPASPPPTRLVFGGAGNYLFSRDGRVGGIDYACIHFAKWDSGEIAYMLWTDLDRQHHSGGYTGGRGHGSLWTLDPEKRIEYMITENRRDEDATVTIDGQEFKLADGTLFLVSTTAEKTLVLQLKRDLSTLGDLSTLNEYHDEYKKMAESDTELQDFFNRLSTQE